MMDLLSISLKAITMIKKIMANEKWTINLILFLSFSGQSSLLFNPIISIQKEEVNAVSAPSALGNNAEIRPMIKMIEIAAGIIPSKAMVGKRSSPGTTTLLA